VRCSTGEPRTISPRWPVRLPARNIGGPGIAALFARVFPLSLALLGVFLGPKRDERHLLVLLGTIVILGAILVTIGLKQWSTLRRTSYLELRDGEVILVAPAFLKEPWAVPRTAVASLTVHDRKRRISDVLPSRPAAPIPSLTAHAGRPNLTVLLGRVLALAPTARSFGVRPSSVADPRAWNRAGRPVAGLRLRLADPAGGRACPPGLVAAPSGFSSLAF
jgi:hypothetical protein